MRTRSIRGQENALDAPMIFRRAVRRGQGVSSKVDAGSREETTSKRRNWSFGSDSIRTDKRSVCRSV
jgi:hypothetical protein